MSLADGVSAIFVIASSPCRETTTLSGAWLRAAARGEANAVWMDFIAGFENGTFDEDVAQRIIDTGHTSGTDALMGFARIVERYFAVL